MSRKRLSLTLRRESSVEPAAEAGCPATLKLALELQHDLSGSLFSLTLAATSPHSRRTPKIVSRFPSFDFDGSVLLTGAHCEREVAGEGHHVGGVALRIVQAYLEGLGARDILAAPGLILGDTSEAKMARMGFSPLLQAELAAKCDQIKDLSQRLMRAGSQSPTGLYAVDPNQIARIEQRAREYLKRTNGWARLTHSYGEDVGLAFDDLILIVAYLKQKNTPN